MTKVAEQDFPPGHPARFDYEPNSPEAVEWRRLNVFPKGERDFPVDHVKAVDSNGSTNHLEWPAGVNPHAPHLEPFTGRKPEQAEALRALNLEAARNAMESKPLHLVEAPTPPQPGEKACVRPAPDGN